MKKATKKTNLSLDAQKLEYLIYCVQSMDTWERLRNNDQFELHDPLLSRLKKALIRVYS